jgi:hypothetical protein
MKRQFLSKISFVLILSMLLSVSLPVLAYAASYINITYDAANGRIHGIIYTENQASITLSTYSNQQWKDIPSEVLGGIKSYLPWRSLDEVYYYSIDDILATGLPLEKINVREDFPWKTNETEISASVTNSVYGFENAAPELYSDGLYYEFEDNGKVMIKIMWKHVQQLDLKGYKVYMDGNLIGTTKDNYYEIHNLEALDKHQFAVSSMPNEGNESPLSYYNRALVPYKLLSEEVGFYDKPVGYSLLPNDTLVTFTSAQDIMGVVADFLKKTIVGLTLGSFIKTDFDGTQHAIPYEIELGELEMSDFELLDEEGNVIPLEDLYTSNGYLQFTFSQILENGKKYTLKMSNTSSGNEISLPEANTNKGSVYLLVMDFINSPYGRYAMSNLVIGDGEAPNKPQGFTATAGDSKIDVNWQANTESDLQGYLVYLDGALLTPTPITRTNYSIVGLANGKTYHVNLAAVDNVGNRSLQAYGYPKPFAVVEDNGNTGNGVGGFVPPPFGVVTGEVPPAAEEPNVKVIKADELKPVEGKLPIAITKEDKKIVLPAGAAAITNDSILTLSSEELDVQIPGDLLMELQKMVPTDQLKDAQISVNFEKLTKEQVNTALENSTGQLANTTVKSAGEVYEFTLSITTKDGKVQKLSVFDQPITLKLKLADDADPNLLGVYYLGDNGEFEYVGGHIVNGFIVVQVSHFSKYAVLEYTKQFGDVPANHWASRAIETLVAQHIVTGVNDSSFAPAKHVTRAEFASLLVRKLGLKAEGEQSFGDVDSKKWYAEDITAAAEAGIVNGRTANIFAPEDTLTRQEMTVMLMKAYGILSGKSIQSSQAATFLDIDKIAEWAIESVSAANKLGFVQGKGGNSFVPLGTSTRAEAVQMIYNLQ